MHEQMESASVNVMVVEASSASVEYIQVDRLEQAPDDRLFYKRALELTPTSIDVTDPAQVAEWVRDRVVIAVHPESNRIGLLMLEADQSDEFLMKAAAKARS